jgi:hypothetical protein
VEDSTRATEVLAAPAVHDSAGGKEGTAAEGTAAEGTAAEGTAVEGTAAKGMAAEGVMAVVYNSANPGLVGDCTGNGHAEAHNTRSYSG